MSGVWPLRMPLLAEWPFLLIACTVRLSLPVGMTDEYGSDTQGFQHIAGFIFVTTTVTHSYGRRLLALRFRASRDPKAALTHPLNVPAPGRRQSIYSALRLRMDLCF